MYHNLATMDGAVRQNPENIKVSSEYPQVYQVSFSGIEGYFSPRQLQYQKSFHTYLVIVGVLKNGNWILCILVNTSW